MSQTVKGPFIYVLELLITLVNAMPFGRLTHSHAPFISTFLCLIGLLYLIMTTFLLPIFTSPVERDIDGGVNTFTDDSGAHKLSTNLRITSHSSSPIHGLRQASATSARSITLPLSSGNNENSGSSSHMHPFNHGRRASSPSWETKNKIRDIKTIKARSVSSTAKDAADVRDKSLTKFSKSKRNKANIAQMTEVAGTEFPCIASETPRSGSISNQLPAPTNGDQQGILQEGLYKKKYQNSAAAPVPSQRLSPIQPHSLRRYPNVLSPRVVNKAQSPASLDAHRERLSDGSSDFIHTIKTASLSNGSFSIMPRSLRIGFSTESSCFLSSHVRHSMDSERPLSNSSLDDAAIRRSFKRRQILEELILTEDSYVADLKALVYLYSTLLASASSIPDRVRSSIQSNVNNLLHIHERLLQSLHRAAFEAAARKWADTTSPSRLAYSRRMKLYGSEATNDGKKTRHQRFTRSSVDSGDITKAHTRLGTSEPEDVLDITRIFKDAMTAFFTYEDYCANHDIIAHELQRDLPQLWSTYESGIESLAKTIMAIDKKDYHGRKGLTVADLLIKPIQRICRYPLLFEDLLSHTPVADSPITHTELDTVIYRLRDVVRGVNIATDNRDARIHIQRRWLLQNRLDLCEINLSHEEFRTLGIIELCGVLHVTYQTTTRIDGSFAVCVLFEQHFLVAMPGAGAGNFKASALLRLADLGLQSATDGKGLQCPSALHSWKICFAEKDVLQELILSACSRIEEEQWVLGLQGNFRSTHASFEAECSLPTRTTLELKSIGSMYTSQRSLSRHTSVRRAATVNNKANITQVILRNTHNAQDLQEYRTPSLAAINRSQSHMNAKRIPVLESKRSDRARMELSISDIWTKERLPFPGMRGSKGGQIIRASAGSLARKLSLASIHAPFSKGRTPSLTLSSKKSYEALNESKGSLQVHKASIGTRSGLRNKPRDIPEVDDMRSVVGRMMAVTETAARSNTSSCGESAPRGRQRKRTRKPSIGVGPEDPAAIFYSEGVINNHRLGSASSEEIDDVNQGNLAAVNGNVASRRKKRWSNPMSMLRGWGSEAKVILLAGK